MLFNRIVLSAEIVHRRCHQRIMFVECDSKRQRYGRWQLLCEEQEDHFLQCCTRPFGFATVKWNIGHFYNNFQLQLISNLVCSDFYYSFVDEINEIYKFILTSFFMWNLLTLCCASLIIQLELVEYCLFTSFYFKKYV